jgi:hypothetical protein
MTQESLESGETEGPTVTLAVLGFESPKGMETLASETAMLMQAHLEAESGVDLVEREKLDALLQEQELDLSGMVDGGEGAKIGKLAGADLLVVGRIIDLGEDRTVVVKVMGVETGRIASAVRAFSRKETIAEPAKDLAAEVAQIVRERGKSLLSLTSEEEDELAQIMAAVQGLEMPRIAVWIDERHINAIVVDPAAQTELEWILRKCRAPLYRAEENALRKWAAGFLNEPDTEIPPILRKAQVAIIGEAFSERGIRRSNLFSCRARVEVQAVDIWTGKVLAVARATASGVDTGEMLAGKNALQAAARKVALEFLPEVLKEWNSNLPEGEVEG